MIEEKGRMRSAFPRRTEAELALSREFEALLAQLIAEGRDVTARRAAFSRFYDSGLPDKKCEDWHYTDLRGKIRSVYPLAEGGEGKFSKADLEANVFRDLKGSRLVIANGYLDRTLSNILALPAGVEVLFLDENEKPLLNSQRGEGNVIGDMNRSFSRNPVLLRVAPGVCLDDPIQLVILCGGAEPVFGHSHIRVELGDGVRLTLLEACLGVGSHQATALLECKLGESSYLDHVRLQDLPQGSQFLSDIQIDVGGSAHFSSFQCSTGADFSRSEMQIYFSGERATAHIGGVSLGSREQFGDVTVRVDHVLPDCLSRQNFRFVLDNQAHAVFQGRIVVHPHAVKTDGKQSSRAILLSESAEMNAKPELEIYADDVQCGHGSTSGCLDKNALFYLMSRGIPRQEALALLVLAFVSKELEQVASDEVRSILVDHTHRWLDRG